MSWWRRRCEGAQKGAPLARGKVSLESGGNVEEYGSVENVLVL